MAEKSSSSSECTTTGRAFRSTVSPARACSYSRFPSTFTAEYMGGTCSCGPKKRRSTASRDSRVSEGGTGPVETTFPSASSVSVSAPSWITAW